MRKILSSIRGKFTGQEESSNPEDYVTLEGQAAAGRASFIVRPLALAEFEDIKEVLDCMRTGNTIVLLNIAPLKEKDIVDLKRAINKLKKTIEACNGHVAGFGDDYIVATPRGVVIQRGGDTTAHVYE